jgi:hypothetical protein
VLVQSSKEVSFLRFRSTPSAVGLSRLYAVPVVFFANVEEVKTHTLTS